jgi:two-component system chemotaxis response regulator CheY
MPFASALRVLIVDDQLTSRLLIRGGLQDLGVSDIEMASNGEEGMQAMKAKPAHLVISDFNMPKLDGLGFLRAVRTYPPTQKVGFILLTGKSDKDLIERAAKLGVNNVIAKPFTMSVLRAKIEAVVGKLK